MRTLLGVFVILFAGCFDSKPKKIYNGEALLTQKCASCHNLDMPPKTYENEKAPPMMAVTFHIKDFMKVDNPAEKKSKFISFVADFALEPSKEKSFCDEKSLEEYGLMPSMKNQADPEELEAIAEFMFDHYEQEKYLKIMTERSKFQSLPLHRQILEGKNCLSCHDIKVKKLAPSFVSIAQKYQNSQTQKQDIKDAIKNGSRGKWEGFRAVMPKFSDLDEKQLDAVASWIVEQK